MLLHNSNSKSEALGPRSTGCTSTTPRGGGWAEAAAAARTDVEEGRAEARAQETGAAQQLRGVMRGQWEAWKGKGEAAVN